MTNPCEQCHIEEKVHVCCGSCPATGERQHLSVSGGRSLLACPWLDIMGRCNRYEARPGHCRGFFCDRYDKPAGRFMYCGF